MRLDHADYITLVSKTYYKLRATGELPISLRHPTVAKIKKHCVLVFQHSFQKKDESMLRDFFDTPEPERLLLQVIKKSDPDKFKPLDNYLKGITEKTDDKNIELLAWLIDFKHRPHHYDKNVQLTDEEVKLLNKPTNAPTGKPPEQEPVNPAGSDSPFPDPQLPAPGKSIKEKLKKAAIYFALPAVCATGIYGLLQQQSKQTALESTNTVCVYWEGDRYKEIPCNAEPKGRNIIPMDPNKIKSFRMITTPDTLTEWSIGKAYYIKDKRSIKYYTEEGKYPEDLNRSLKVLSPYMFDKYLRKEKIPEPNSLAGQQ